MRTSRLYLYLFTVIILFYEVMEVSAQTIRRDDYRINDENYTSTSGADQIPDIASSAGGFTVVWQHTRPDFGIDVMTRLFDEAGKPIGKEFRVNDDTTMQVAFTAPRVARHFPPNAIGDTVKGTFAVVWGDGAPLGSVFMQRYFNDGTPLGKNIRIDETAPTGTQSEPAVATDRTAPAASASYIAAWSDRRDYSDIYSRIITGDGTPAGSSFKVNEDTTRLTRGKPAIAAGGSVSRFIVTWEEADMFTFGMRRVMGRLFMGNGKPIGASFQVDTLVPTAFTPSVSMAPDGSFVVAYMSVAAGRSYLYTQRFLSNGKKDGDPVEVDSGAAGNQRGPDITTLAGRDAYGYGFVVTWEDVPPDSADEQLYFRLFDGRSTPLGGKSGVNNPPDASLGSAAVALVGYGNVNPPPSRSFVVWQDMREGDLDIEGEIFEQGNAVGSNFRVNGVQTGAASQRRSAIGATTSGFSVAIWEDRRGIDADIYAKRQSSSGAPLGDDFRINDDAGAAEQTDPDLALLPDSSFVVVWTDSRRESARDIFMGRFDATGRRIGDNVVVNDTSGEAAQQFAAVASGTNGEFVVVWLDRRDADSGQIYAQRFDRLGQTVGRNFRVDNDTSGWMHTPPAVATSPDGGFIVVWSDARRGDLDIWAQEYNASGARTGDNFKVNVVSPTEPGSVQTSPAIDISPGGVAMIAWLDYRSQDSARVYAQYFQSGDGIGSNIRVSDPEGFGRRLCLECREQSPTVAAAKLAKGTERDNSFVVAWTDYRNGTDNADIYAQWFANSLSPAGGNELVNNAAAGIAQESPDIARDGIGGIYFSWDDSRELLREDWSIWGKILEERITSSVTPDAADGSAVSGLLYNSPNPFRESTTFTFSLPEPGHVRLEIFSSRGQKVATVLDENLPTGRHHIAWNASELAAGIYFYQMQRGETFIGGQLIVLE